MSGLEQSDDVSINFFIQTLIIGFGQCTTVVQGYYILGMGRVGPGFFHSGRAWSGRVGSSFGV